MVLVGVSTMPFGILIPNVCVMRQAVLYTKLDSMWDSNVIYLNLKISGMKSMKGFRRIVLTS